MSNKNDIVYFILEYMYLCMYRVKGSVIVCLMACSQAYLQRYWV